MDPSLNGWAPLLSVIQAKAPPALAPGNMALLGLLGFACAFSNRTRITFSNERSQQERVMTRCSLRIAAALVLCFLAMVRRPARRSERHDCGYEHRLGKGSPRAAAHDAGHRERIAGEASLYERRRAERVPHGVSR